VLFYGGDIKGNDLILVAATKDAAGNLHFHGDQCTKITLLASDQEGVKAFHKSLEGFVTAHGITAVSLRARSVGGPYKGGPAGFKIETIVQMLNSVRVTIVSPLTISAWAKKGATLPKPKFTYQQQALEAACFEADKAGG
jgi:hypothetical protein